MSGFIEKLAKTLSNLTQDERKKLDTIIEFILNRLTSEQKYQAKVELSLIPEVLGHEISDEDFNNIVKIEIKDFMKTTEHETCIRRFIKILGNNISVEDIRDFVYMLSQQDLNQARNELNLNPNISENDVKENLIGWLMAFMSVF